MTNEHDPIEENIPGLMDHLQGSLNTPDPSAIHAGLSERQALHRRILGGAGAFVAILVLAGGVFAITRDNDTINTETAAADDSDPLIFEFGDDAVAKDSAPIEIDPIRAGVSIRDCANGSFISLGSSQWLAWDLPPEWKGQDSVQVTVVIDDNTLVATDENGLSAPFVRNDGQARRQPCLGFTLGEDIPADSAAPIPAPYIALLVPDVTGMEFEEALDHLFVADMRTARVDEVSTTVPSGVVIRTDPPAGTSFGLDDRPVITIFVSSGPPPESVVPVPETTIPAGPRPDAVLATEAKLDGEPGNEQIWLDPDGTLHAGDLVGLADYWDVSDFWFDEQAELTTAQFDDDTIAIVLSLPIADEDEDPPNTVQIFLVQEQGLSRVFNATLGSSGVHPITFNGDGSVSYVEDGWTACRQAERTGVVARQTLTLTQGADGQLIQSSSEDSGELQDCSQLAG